MASLRLQLERFQITAERGAEFRILQSKLYGSFQETELVSRVIGNTVIDVSPQPMLAREDAQRISKLNFISRAGLRASQAIENSRRQDVAPGNAEIRRRIFRFRFLHEVANTKQSLAKRRLRRGFAIHDAVEMSFVPGNFLDGDGADAGGFVDVDKLLGRGIRAGDQHVTEQDRERFVADKVASNENGVAKPERFLLPRVAELQHVADFSNQLGLIFFPFLFQKALERRRRIEMIFDGILAFAGDDNDVLDSRRDAFFRDVLNLRLVDDGEHLFGLRFGGGKEARAEAGGREDRLSNFLMRVHGAISRRSVRNGGRIRGHSLSFSEARKRSPSFFDGLKKQLTLMHCSDASRDSQPAR